LKFLDHGNRGFGFIFRDNSDVEDFLHVSNCQHLNVNALKDGAPALQLGNSAERQNSCRRCRTIDGDCVMFGIGSKISAKIDHVAAFKRVVDMAISEARDAHVGSREIVGYLRSRAQALEDQAYAGPYTQPKHYDGHGRPIDMAAKIQAAERERQRRIDEASVIPPHLRQSAASGYRVP
jgi:hypothetical protein